ncbi:hypothetical protein LSH36_583g00005, partial [Paralvinella palmiformis]
CPSPTNPQQTASPKATTKTITAFTLKIPGTADESRSYSGIISDKTISVVLPTQDLTALSPTITHTGKSITPASGTAQDFTKPVSYTVTAEDDSTAVYTVKISPLTITIEQKGTTLTGETPSVLGNAIVVEALPYNAEASAYKDLTAKIMFGTRSLSCEANPDFKDPVTYTFTLPDSSSSTEKYTLTIKNKPLTRKQLDTMIRDRKDISMVNTATITDMQDMFNTATAFNQDISRWDVSKVTTMDRMFYNANAFNGDISGWDVSKVTNMSYIFYNANAFNGDISGWDVSKVTTMREMFEEANAFNGDISGWDVSKVTTMSEMFGGAKAFNQDISGWDVSKVTDMNHMFQDATAFNQDISGWDVSKVTDMNHMFSNAKAFNQDISGWDVSKVITMDSMFYNATAFNQNISGWNVGKVTSMSHMFDGAIAFNKDISGWDVSKVTSMSHMFDGAIAFNKDISSWKNKVVEGISHAAFSGGSCPLQKSFHPYESWADATDKP